ncbi:uncharacterized protein LOC127706184 [Mytilus californianus]|uniref:uncharacterized protein LOC127706184 n=1 Tax=Mytilus californianus TaxID=6549 RepID=UPI0022456F9C|nr:uncharacterized protein LOC127706184 [Mytilus californianus]
MSNSMWRKLQKKIDNETCQPTSRYLKYKIAESQDLIAQDPMTACQFCGSDYTPTQRRVRIKSKVKLSKKLGVLLRKYETDPNSLGKFQSNLVQTYLKSCNTLVVMCNVCKKKTKYPCLKREDLIQQKVKEKQILQNKCIIEPEKKSKKKKRKKKKERDEVLDQKPPSLQSDTVDDIDRQEIRITSPQLGTSSHTYSKNSLIDATDQGTLSKLTDSRKSSAVTHNRQSLTKKPDIQGNKRTRSEENITKSAKKRKAKNLNQQLNQILANEKSESKSGNLMDFLSSL